LYGLFVVPASLQRYKILLAVDLRNLIGDKEAGKLYQGCSEAKCWQRGEFAPTPKTPPSWGENPSHVMADNLMTMSLDDIIQAQKKAAPQDGSSTLYR